MRRRWLGWGMLWLAWTGGCAPEEFGPPRCAPPDALTTPVEPNLVLSLGDEGEPFVPYEDGGAARLVRGAQGGWMLVVHLEVAGGPASERVCTRLELASEGLEEEAVARWGAWVDFDREGRGVLGGLQWLLGWDESTLRGRRITVRARLVADRWLGERRLAGMSLR